MIHFRSIRSLFQSNKAGTRGTAHGPQGTVIPPVYKVEPRKKFRLSRKRKALLGAALLIFWLAGVMIYHTHKPLPPGLSYESPVYRTDNVSFWYDLNVADGSEYGRHEGQIFPRMLDMIGEARQFVIVDMFLFNAYIHEGQHFPPIAEQLTEKLIEQKRAYPGMDIAFITDEVNTNYDSAPNELLEAMKAEGIRVVVTDVNALRDSTPAYSAVWRTFFQWFGQSGNGWLPNLMADQGPDITVRSYLKLLNVKANHRKVVVTENSALISSGNVHNASSYHSNIAFEVNGPVIRDIVVTEQAAADLSGAGPLLGAGNAFWTETAPQEPDEMQEGGTPEEGLLEIRYLTEGKIYKAALADIASAGAGDVVWMGMFYLADRPVLDALLEAEARGAEIRLLLDPNQNAFGRDKIGIPNRPAAMELNRRSDESIQIRWYNTTKEQYHSKLMFVERAEGNSYALGGSTNFTPRNLDDYNLENNVWVSMPQDAPLRGELKAYFEQLWFNRGETYSLPLSAYQSNLTGLKYMLYRLQTALGFTTF